MGNEGVDSSQVKMGISSKMGGCCSNKSFLLSVLGFVFVILNLAALWALHFADRPGNKGGLRSATRFTTTELSATDGTSPTVGDAVSFNTDNVLRNGAGTTTYLNKLTLGADLDDILYVNFAPMGTSKAYYSTNVMSYVRTEGTTTDSVITTLSYSASNKTLVAGEAVVVTNTVRGLATLTDTQMAVLTVGKSGSDTVVSAVPASLDGAAGTVTVNQAKAAEVTKNSPTNFIAPLSSSSFIVAYYEKYASAGYWQSARVGSMATDGTITLSGASKTFGVKNDDDFLTNFGSPLALKGLGAGVGFVIPYYTALNPWAGTIKTIADLSGLCVTSATFASNTQSAFTTGVCNTNYRPGQYPESVALSDNSMAIVFHDEANNHALTVATVSVSSDKSLHFRSSYVFPEVGGDFDLYDLSTTPRPRVLSGNRLAVSFLNPTLNGRLSVRVLSFSPSTLALKELTPVLPVAPSNFTLYVSDANDYTLNKAIVHDMLPVSADAFVTAYVGKRNNVLYQNFAVTEAFGNPVGIVQSTSSDKSGITMQGNAEVSGLTAGAMHYATTTGDVVAPDSKSTDSNSAEYFYTAGDAMLVTTDSRVGIAIDDDTLFVSTAF